MEARINYFLGAEHKLAAELTPISLRKNRS